MVGGVRARITIIATTVVLLVLAGTGAALVAAQRAVLTDNVDEQLVRHGDQIAREIDAGTLGVVISGQGDDDAFARVVDASGVEIASTAYTPGSVSVAALDGTRRFVTMPAEAGEFEYRVLLQRHQDLLIMTGSPLDDVEESVGTLTRGLAVAVPAAALVLAVLVWVLVGRVLSPVEQIRRGVAEINGHSLDRRVPQPRGNDEIARLARTMNEMLQRIEESSERQRRFVADASHELRSPLTRIRTELEVDLAHPSETDLAATHRSVLEETDTLQRLVDDLLTLARADSPNAERRRDPVDLDDIVMAEVGRLDSAARSRVDASAVSAGQVSGDAIQLARVVRNLLENAIQHGGHTVSVSVQEEGDEVVLVVADDGPGIPADLRHRIFDRFSRIDEARSTTTGGTGLGLAIVRQLVTTHEGTVEASSDDLAGAQFTVRLRLRTSTG